MLWAIIHKKNRTLILSAMLLGLAMSMSLAVSLVWIMGLSFNQFLFSIILLDIGFFVLTYWLLGKILPDLLGYSLKTKLLWAFCCIAAGIGLTHVIPLNMNEPSYHALKIIASGQSNARAKGSEVWLYSIKMGNGFKLNNENLSLSQGWQNRDTTLLSYEHQPAVIEYYGPLSGDLTLAFGSHPWSGQVHILLDGNEQILDLYSDTTTSKSVVLPIKSSAVFGIIVLAGYYLSLSFVVFIISILFISRESQLLAPVLNLPQPKEFISPETVFLSLAIFFGLLFVLVTPPFQVADEDAHFNYAYAVSMGEFHGYRSVTPHSITGLMGITDHLPFYPEKKISYKKILEFINVPLNLNEMDPSFYQSVSKVNPMPYVPIAIGLEIAKILNLNALDFFYFGRIFHLCVWVFISYLALKLLPAFKWMFLLLILSPMSLSIAGSYSADAITNSISFLWFALCFNYSTRKENGIGLKQRTLFIIIAALLSLTKPPYFLLLGLFFIIPHANFGSLRQYQRTSVLLFAISLFFIFFSLSYLRNDYSTTNSSPLLDFGKQIHHLLNNPLEFPRIIYRSIKLFWMFYLTSYIGRLGWLDTVLPKYIYSTYPLIIVLTSLIDQKKHLFFSPWQKIVSFVTAGAVFSAVFLSLYLTWTPVGYKTLEGLQGRYLIPVGPTLIPLFISKYFSKSPSWKSILVVVYLTVVLSITVRTLILRFYLF